VRSANAPYDFKQKSQNQTASGCVSDAPSSGKVHSANTPYD
jgi:hypothetical protein